MSYDKDPEETEYYTERSSFYNIEKTPFWTTESTFCIGSLCCALLFIVFLAVTHREGNNLTKRSKK